MRSTPTPTSTRSARAARSPASIVTAAAAALALLAACGPSSSHHTTFSAPAVCDNVVQQTILPDGMVEDLGTHTVGDQVAFTVATGTGGFYIVSQEVGRTAAATVTASGMSLPNAVVPTGLVSPGGTLYYDDLVGYPTTTISGLSYSDLTGLLSFDPGFQAAVSVFPFPSTSGALQKLAADGQVEPGTWRFTVNDWARQCPFSGCASGDLSGKYRVSVVKRIASLASPGSGVLDVDVYLATALTSPLASVTAATQDSSGQVARWKQALAYYLAKAGISLGTVTFHDLPLGVRAKYAPNGAVDVTSSDPCSPLAQLFTAATASSRAVSIFLADELIQPSQPTFQIVGMDGAIPGPSGYPGTISSGAVVSLVDFGFGTCGSWTGAPDLQRCGTDVTAYITTHEIGHWLGLFHTTESYGTDFDTLSDTAVCPCNLCAAASGHAQCADVNPSAKSPTQVLASECVASASCGGGDNLMFWLLDTGTSTRPPTSTGQVTAQQAQVMRMNPAVQ